MSPKPFLQSFRFNRVEAAQALAPEPEPARERREPDEAGGPLSEALRIKSFYGWTVEEALAKARVELGAEAMILNTRATPPELRALGGVEVVCGSPDPPAAPQSAPPEEAGAGLGGGADELLTALMMELNALRKQVSGIQTVLSRSQYAMPRSLMGNPAMLAPFSRLLDAGLDAVLAGEILQELHDRQLQETRSLSFQALNPRALAGEIRAQLAARLNTGSGLGLGPREPRVALFVGPPGSGKTTTLVKLAVKSIPLMRRPVRILSLDNYRVGAADHLRSFAGIMGVGFDMVDSPAALGRAIEAYSASSLILVDTPGYGANDLDHGMDLARWVTCQPFADVHLVLSACLEPGALRRSVDRFEVFQPGKLLFTMLDNCERFGPCYAEALRTGKAISYLGTGQRIPEDIEAAQPDKIAGLILPAGD